MLDVIEKLLALQSHDQKILKTQEELSGIAPQREAAKNKASSTAQQLDQAKNNLKHLESERKRLELEVEAKEELIRKYSTQQAQTKKNEEYKAFSNQIDNCKQEISNLEDQELMVLEQIDGARQLVGKATEAAKQDKAMVDGMVAKLDEREQALKKELDGLLGERQTFSSQLEDGTLNRYERLFKNKAGRALVGVVHSACGGCHMKLPTQVIVGCQGEQELITCPNCARILYYTQDMDLKAAE